MYLIQMGSASKVRVYEKILKLRTVLRKFDKTAKNSKNQLGK